MEITNKTLDNGQLLTIKSGVPILGLSLLKNYSDETLGEMGQSKFLKNFRYSEDGGGTFSSWKPLDDKNISKVTFSKNCSLVIECEFIHSGVRNPMYFSEISFDAEISDGSINDIYNKTDFSEYFRINDTEVINWAYNVLEKLYENGILPKYYSRSNIKDFQDYWLTVTHFFALIVKAGRLLENLPNNKVLFERFLNGRGLFLSGEETQQQREYLFNNYINEYSKRGTVDIFKKDLDGNLGEALRLVNYISGENIVSTLKNSEIGWCLGYSSPTWDNSILVNSLYKGYEYGGDVVDVSKYPVRGDTKLVSKNGHTYMILNNYNYLGPHLSNYDETNVIEFGNSILGFTDGQTKNIFSLSNSLDYEVSFIVSRDNLCYLEFGVMALDENFLPITLFNSKDGSKSNIFGNFEITEVLGGEAFICGSVLSKGKPFNEKYTILTPNGNNLINYDGSCKYLMPYIKVLSDGDVCVRDVKLKPLNLPSSQGQLGEKDVLLSYIKNNSFRSNEYIMDSFRSYLLPYKTIMWNEFINN